MNYRDIREDLRQRITDIRDQRKAAEEQYRVTVRSLDDREKALQKLLEDENHRFPSYSPSTVPRVEAFTGSPSQLAMIALADGKPHTLEEIKAKAGELGLRAADGAYLGRVLHGALVSLKREGIVDVVGPSTWQNAHRNTASVSPEAVEDVLG